MDAFLGNRKKIKNCKVGGGRAGHPKALLKKMNGQER